MERVEAVRAGARPERGPTDVSGGLTTGTKVETREGRLGER